MGSVNEVLSHKLCRLFADLWFLMSTYVFHFISSCFLRLRIKGTSLKYSSTSSLYEQNNKNDSDYVEVLESKGVQEKGFKEDVTNFRENERGDLSEKETIEFRFSFKFPTYDEFCRTKRENVVSSEAAVSSTDISCHEFMSNMSFSASVEETEPISLQVEEVSTEKSSASFEDMDVDDVDEYLSDVISVNGVNVEDLDEKNESMTFAVDEEETSEEDYEYLYLRRLVEKPVHKHMDAISVNGVNGEELNEKNRSMTLPSDEVNNLNFWDDMELSSIGFNDDGVLSDGELELDHLMEIYGHKVESYDQISDFDESQGSNDFDGEDSDIMEELKNLEENNLTNSMEFHEESDKFKYKESCDVNDDKPIESSEIADSKNSKFLEEDSDELEALWEQQELMEQLKMELKKVRATGLPTILEESESPKIMDDLKPWKIEEKFQHENPMDELHKFYKSYSERMRKFDMLNYQKMYAIGFLQLKDPQSNSKKKISVPEIASYLRENLHLQKSKKSKINPTGKFINELMSELEVAYVGQMCLSWEFLHWQYGMVLDLWGSDPRRVRRYNEVAGEFQHFQVLVQRFLEEEPFQGPRVQNYTKHRSVMRNFLQVPLVRDDNANDKKKARRSQGDEYCITSDLLVEIVEESMRLLWRFIRADKRTKLTSQKQLPLNLQDPSESDILLELKKDLQKKKRKLKDQLRSTNCIVKKFQKCRDDNGSSDPVVFFFCQVDMKLVSRVLSMSKLTAEQLEWCRSKLNAISFTNRNIHVEPSFCLFPC